MNRIRDPQTAAHGRSSGLPSYTGEFVGRAGRVREVTDALADGPPGVALVGPPGVGKTRLATEVGRRLIETADPPSRVAFCDLRAARTSVDIIATVADVLDLPLSSRRDPEGAADFIAQWVREEPALLILDNFEQILEAGEPLLEQWFADGGAATALVTTRRPPEVDGIRCIDVAPLDGGDAVQLYRDRGGAGAVDAREATAIDELVERLDHLPLAIELAAARLPVLGPSELLERLDRQLEVLQEPSEDFAEWKPALREALTSSWSLLEPWERETLVQLASFRGAFSIEAAERVVDLGDVDGAPPVAQVVHSLLEHSLLRTDTTVAGRRHFSLFESVREFAAREGAGRAARRHAAYFADRATQLRDDFYREQASEALAEFAFQSGNVRRAFDWAVEAEPLLAARIAGPLVTFLNIREPYQDDLAILEETLEALEGEEGGAEVERATGRIHLFFAKRWQTRGAREPAADHFETALAIAREAEAVELEVEILKDLGFFWVFHGEVDRAEAALEEGFEALEQLDEPERVEAPLHMHAGLVAEHRGEIEEARRRYNRALTMHRQTGNVRYAAGAHHNLGLLEAGIGNFERAVRAKQEALETHRLFDDLPQMAGALGDIGNSYAALGELEKAASAFDQAVDLAEQLRHAWYHAEFLAGRALVTFERGEHAEAAAMLDEALSIAEQEGAERLETNLLARKAIVQFASGNLAEGEESTGALREMLEANEDRRTELLLEIATAQRALTEARRALEEGEFALAGERLEAAKAAAGVDDESKLVGQRDAYALARIIARRIREFEEAYADELAAAGEALHVSADRCQWFEWEDEVVDLSRRGAPRRILARLVEAHAEAPGRGLDTDQIVEAGWPDEPLHPEAAKSRVYTAIRTLRDFGLRDLLLTTDEGYVLDPEVPIIEHDERR